LHLRAERALGLGALPVPAPAPAEPHLADTPAPVNVRSAKSTDLKQAAAVLPGKPLKVLMPMPIAEPFTSAPLSPAQKKIRLAELDENEVKGCTRCRLHSTRTHTVFGEGDPNASIFFIGEGPGENEDLTGRPFIGRAGDLLTKMIVGVGLSRDQVYIANIVKCRPPNNRVPAPDEVATCTTYLERQLEIIRPKAIVTLGLPASQYMLQTKSSMGNMRGQWHSWRGIKLMPTYHPAYVLRNYTEETRRAVWDDLKKVVTELGMKVPARK